MMQAANSANHPIPIETDVLIVGAGPCGLGAARRCEELIAEKFPRIENWLLIERSTHPGGNASSFTDAQGFTWDSGGHVICSHYPYFDRFLNDMLGDDIEQRKRYGWVWLSDRYIPFPVQDNLQRLPADQLLACLKSLPRKEVRDASDNFKEWLESNFGSALCDLFFFPYNRKMWAHDPAVMATGWTGRKSGSRFANVPLASLDKLLENVVQARDTPGWEGSSTFPYPRSGGGGGLWKKAFEALPAGRARLGTSLVSVNAEKQEAVLSTGETVRYRRLISSMPLPKLIGILDDDFRQKFPASTLKHAHSHVVGVGVRGALPAILKDKCWIHVATPTIPFFRVTVVSNYSRFNVPQDSEHWSVMCETCTSAGYPLPVQELQAAVEEGLRQMGVLAKDDVIVSRWNQYIEHGYPVPCLERDQFLTVANTLLTSRNIYSRGRFGAWKYEVSNQDNAFMQGVEAVDRFVFGGEELTYHFPEIACQNVIDRVLPRD